ARGRRAGRGHCRRAPGAHFRAGVHHARVRGRLGPGGPRREPDRARYVRRRRGSALDAGAGEHVPGKSADSAATDAQEAVTSPPVPLSTSWRGGTIGGVVVPPLRYAERGTGGEVTAAS